MADLRSPKTRFFLRSDGKLKKAHHSDSGLIAKYLKGDYTEMQYRDVKEKQPDGSEKLVTKLLPKQKPKPVEKPAGKKGGSKGA